jgi:hypothetical protein
MNIAKKPGLGIENFVATPKRDLNIRKRKAVALDCEWGKAGDRRSELLSICVVDFLTGRTLIDSLVAPSQSISEWRSHIHGIIAEAMEDTTGGRNYLRGWEEARTKLFNYVDDETILVGHSIRDDLRLLRIFHKTIVDSQVLAADAVFKNVKKRPGYKWPIDKICEGFLGISIHRSATLGDQAYSNLENVLASREIVLHCIRRPGDLEEWGKQARGDFWKPKDRKKAIKAATSTADRKCDSVASSAADQTVDHTVNHIVEQQSQLSVHIPDRNERLIPDSNAFIAGYQTAYQTAFQKGFQIGYERGSQEANLDMNQTWKNYKDRDRCHYEIQRNSWKADQDADERGVSDDRNIKLDRNDRRTLNHATENKGSHLQSSKRIQTENMTQRANQNRDQNAMIKTGLIENWLAEMPHRYADKKGEQNVVLEQKTKRNVNKNDLGKAQKKASKKAQRKAKRKAKQEAKEKTEMESKWMDRKMKKGAERKVLTSMAPREAQAATLQTLWGFEEVVQERQDSESMVDVITWISETNGY